MQLPGQEGARGREGPEDRQPRGPRGGDGSSEPAVLVRHSGRSSPPRLAAGRERLARRVEQASDGRTDCRGARRRRRVPASRSKSSESARSLARPIAIATGAGALLALAILAMTVGLIRSESAGDLRTLTATGATSRSTAHTDGHDRRRTRLPRRASRGRRHLPRTRSDIPRRPRLSQSGSRCCLLVLIVVGVPLTATAAGWLLAGREPAAIARPVFE